MDACRENTEIEIQKCAATARMLDHLARAVQEGPTSQRSALYPHDAIEALLHGAECARRHGDNLRDCVAIYDELVARPVPDPREASA